MIREESALPVPKRKGCLDVFLPNKNTLPLADTHTNMYMLARKAAKQSVISEIHTRIHKRQEGKLKRCYWQLAGHFKILIYHLNPPGAKTAVMEMFYCLCGSRMQYCKIIKLHEIHPPPTSSFYTPPPLRLLPLNTVFHPELRGSFDKSDSFTPLGLFVLSQISYPHPTPPCCFPLPALSL